MKALRNTRCVGPFLGIAQLLFLLLCTIIRMDATHAASASSEETWVSRRDKAESGDDVWRYHNGADSPPPAPTARRGHAVVRHQIGSNGATKAAMPRRALLAADSFDAIRLWVEGASLDGTRTEIEVGKDLTWSSELTVETGSDVAIHGVPDEHNGKTPVMDAANASSSSARRHLIVKGTLTLQQLTFKGGLQQAEDGYQGGSIQLLGGTLIAVGCSFENNQVSGRGGGGAIYMNGGILTATNCIFASNRVRLSFWYSRGGGAIHAHSGTLRAIGCAFENNQAINIGSVGSGEDGGGSIYVDNAATLYASGSTFENNQGIGDSGDAICSKTSLTLNDCKFIGNQGGGFITTRSITRCAEFDCGAEPTCTDLEWGFACTCSSPNTTFDEERGCVPCPGGKDCSSSSTISGLKPCPVGHTCPRGMALPIACPESSISTRPGLQYPTECNSTCTVGSYCPHGLDSTPLSCPRGNYCSLGATEPVRCPSSTFQPLLGRSFNDSCRTCAPGKRCPAGTAWPLPCPAGYYCPDVGSETAVPCPAGVFSAHADISSVEECSSRCKLGHYCPAGSTQPIECEPGQFCVGANATAPTLCPPGSFCSNAREVAPTLCPAGRYSALVGRVEPCDQLCPAGRFSESKGASHVNTCLECNPGYFADRPGHSACEACRVGYFSSVLGLNSSAGCQQCPLGRWGSDAGIASPSHCTPCERGKYGVSSGTSDERDGCASCPASHTLHASRAPTRTPYFRLTHKAILTQAGNFSDIAGRTNCKQCDRGRTSAVGSAGCFYICALGQYFVANTTCLDCPPGRYGDHIGGALDESGCKTCGAGTICPSGAAQRSCPKGKWSSAVGASSEDSCVQCTPGRFSAARGADAAESCNPCPPGRFGNTWGADAAVSCAECAPGRFTGRGAQTACSACVGGTSSKQGSSYCFDCAAGKFLNASSDAPVCAPCPGGSVSKAGALKCTPCEVGTYQNGTDCVACPAGRHGNTTGLTTSACSGDCPPGTHSYRYATKCSECDSGKHAPNATTEECLSCASIGDGLTSASGATECACVASKYRNARGVCVPCTEGMDCAEIGSALESLAVEAGYWRPCSSATDEVKDCPVSAACVGSAASGAENATVCGCLKGNEGVLCAVCEKDYYRPSKYSTCKACGGRGAAVATMLAVLVAMLLALGAFVTVNRRAPSGLLRPFINLVQTITVMLKYDAPFPPALVAAGRVLAGLSFGVELASPQCAGLGSSFYTILVLEVCGLVGLCTAMLAPTLAAKVHNGWTWSEMLASEAAAKTFRDLFVVVLLVYPTTSGKAMEFFRCQTIDGVAYLMADYSLECNDGAWFAMLPLVLFVLVFFSLGLPVLIAYVLHKRRDKLYDDAGKPIPQPLDILFAIYQPDAYWFESVLMVAKLALWATLVFFEHGSEMQLATALVVNVLQLCVHLVVLPMGGEEAVLLNRMQAATLVLTAYINFGALSMNYLALAQKYAAYVDPQSVGDYDGRIAVIATIMEILTFGLFLSFGGAAIKKAYKVAQETSLDDVRAKLAAALPRAQRSSLSSQAKNPDAVLSVVSSPQEFASSNPMHAGREAEVELTAVQCTK